MDGDEPAAVRIVLRPLGSGLPLGFFAFATGMVVLAGVDVPFLQRSEIHSAAVLLLSFVAPLEALAAVLAFLARDGLAGCGLALFAASWATLGVQDLLAAPGATNPALGLYLVTFAVVVLLLGIVAIRGQALLAGILVAAAVRTALAGGYELGAPKPLLSAAGILALVIAAVALYGGLALLLEDTAHHTVLPLARRGAGQEAVRGDIAAQLRGLESEAGVRRSL